MATLQAIKYQRGSLSLLDQRLLPFETVYLPVPDPQTAWQHIKDMVVRGAPAIGVTGALALAVDLVAKGAGSQFSSVDDTVKGINATLDFLVTSRPTAVNLQDASDKHRNTAAQAAAQPGATPSSVVEAVVAAAEAFYDDDIRSNKAIGDFGAEALLKAAQARGRGVGGKLRVLTHCNTGSLATAEFGTALGVVRALHKLGKLEHAFCTETRPYNQGARLTAFELVHEGMPATLICDSAAAALMASGQVDAVVVGADRVVANGDTANKIGTYSLSIAAGHHDVPFFIAAPTTTLDPVLPSGQHIVIEQRPEEEVTHFRGSRVVVEGIKVWNPSFDVAPAKLIEGIITEVGCVPKQGDAFQVRAFMDKHGLLLPQHKEEAGAGGAASSSSTSTFLTLDTHKVVDYVLAHPTLAALVGNADSASGWQVREVGDGNINFVYIVEGPQGGVCIKQALPYVRIVGEGWPLTQDRLRIEAAALQAEHAACPQHVPQVLHYDASNAIMAMQYLAPPFTILRHAMCGGAVYPHLARHVAEFCATSLYSTSALAMTGDAFRAQVAKFSNTELCSLTEQVIFSEPYADAANNHWTSPQLDAQVVALRSDVAAKQAASALKRKFMTHAEALLHGDLHTGSIMVTPDSTMLIDPEFAYVGPMAFDVGKFVGNLLLALFASDGHNGDSSRSAQQAWISSSIAEFWNTFSKRFLELWSGAADTARGDLLPALLAGSAAPAGAAALAAVQQSFMEQMYGDVLQFAGACMIRRIVGIAHVKDMDSIEPADRRAACEGAALAFGRALMVGGASAAASIEELVAKANTARAQLA